MEDLNIKLKTRNAILRYVNLSNKFKTAYFWSSPRTSEKRQYMEKMNQLYYYDDNIELSFKIQVSAKNVYVIKSVKIDGKKTNLTALKKYLKLDFGLSQSNLDLTYFLDKYNKKYTIVGDKVVGDYIFFDNCKLFYLPESIGDLNCKLLELRYNNLTSLPESFGNIKCKSLDLRNNNLTSLPKLNENITNLSIDNFDDLTNLIYLPNLISLWLDDKYYIEESLSELLNKIRHQKVMNKMNKILETF